MNVCATIMAGGKGARFGGEGPKFLAPLSDGSTLLTRLMSQLAVAAIDEICVCCSPENADVIRSFLATRRPDARVVACGNCSLGPLPALAEALAAGASEWRMLCLADIYFQTNPFMELRSKVVEQPGAQGWLFTGLDESKSRSGWLICNDSKVQAISYDPTPGANLRWTGAFLFHKTQIDYLTARAHDYAHKPFEVWIGDLIAAGNGFGWIDVGPFVNVNSLDDHTRLLERTQPDHENKIIGAARD